MTVYSYHIEARGIPLFETDSIEEACEAHDWGRESTRLWRRLDTQTPGTLKMLLEPLKPYAYTDLPKRSVMRWFM